MGSTVNKLTAPFGVKAFKGGPYADKGVGDKQLKQLGDANAIYNELAGYGRRLLQPGGTGRTQMPQQGAGEFYSGRGSYRPVRTNDPFSGLQDATESYASDIYTPLGMNFMDSFQNALKAYGNYGGVSDYTAGGDPYSLDPNQEKQLNQSLDLLNNERNTALSGIKARLAARGITEGPALEAAIDRLNERYDSEINKHKTGFMEQIRGNRQQTQGDILRLLPGAGQFQEAQRASRLGEKSSLADAYSRLIGQGTSLVGAGAGGLQSGANQLGDIAARNAQTTNNAWSNLTGFAGMLAGGFGGGMRSPRQPFDERLRAGASGVGGITGGLYGS